MFILRRPRVPNFADIIETAAIIFKTTFEDSKRIKKNVLKSNLDLHFQ